MKNLLKFITLAFSSFVIFSSCEDSKNTVDIVLDPERGAVLRTIEVQNAILNSSNPDSEFSVTVEAQDEEDGGLMESVDVYVSIRDLTPDNGETVVNDAFVKTIERSAFTTGPLGLPRGTITATFAEMATAMGLDSDDYFPGDVFIVELRLNLTDGRTYGADSAGGIITGGFYSSPFKYNALITCSPQPGTYRVEMHDTFGDGWQTNDGNGGDGIHVDIDGTIVVVGMCSPYGGSNTGSEMDESQGLCTPNNGFDATAYVTIPPGTESATWTFPGDTYGEISFEIYGPNDELLLAVGVGEGTPGLLPVTLCAN